MRFFGTTVDFELTAEQAAARDMAVDFARRKSRPIGGSGSGVCSPGPHRKMAAAGMFGCLFPEEYEEAGWVRPRCSSERYAPIESGMPFNNQGVNVPMAIYRWGTKRKNASTCRLVSAKYIGCFALAEPGGGSDSAAMKTRALRKGGRYNINGSKMWSTLGSVADLILLFAKTDPDRGHAGVSAFLVETKGLKGFSARPIPCDIGTSCIPTAELSFQDVEIAADSLLGEVEGQGFKAAMSTLQYGRVCVPARGLGIAQACLDMAVQYAKERVAFGKKIGEFQAIQHTIADMLAKTEASRWLIYRAAARADQGLPFGREASIASISPARRHGYHREMPGGLAVTALPRNSRIPLFHLRPADAHREGSANIQKSAGNGRVGLKKIDRHGL